MTGGAVVDNEPVYTTSGSAARPGADDVDKARRAAVVPTSTVTQSS